MAQSLRDIMTRNVITVSPEQSVVDAAKIMSQNDVGSVPVVEKGICTGIVTDRDIVLRAVAEGQDIRTAKIRSVMTGNVVTGTPDMDVHKAADLMADKQIRRLPVVDNGKLVGIVALGDFAVVDIYQNEAGEALSYISEPAQPQM